MIFVSEDKGIVVKQSISFFSPFIHLQRWKKKNIKCRPIRNLWSFRPSTAVPPTSTTSASRYGRTLSFVSKSTTHTNYWQHSCRRRGSRYTATLSSVSNIRYKWLSWLSGLWKNWKTWTIQRKKLVRENEEMNWNFFSFLTHLEMIKFLFLFGCFWKNKILNDLLSWWEYSEKKIQNPYFKRLIKIQHFLQPRWKHSWNS